MNFPRVNYELEEARAQQREDWVNRDGEPKMVSVILAPIYKGFHQSAGSLNFHLHPIERGGERGEAETCVSVHPGATRLDL